MCVSVGVFLFKETVGIICHEMSENCSKRWLIFVEDAIDGKRDL